MKKVVSNSLFSAANFAITTPVFFLLVPYMLLRLGEKDFGVWSLVSVIGMYNVFIDMGFSQSMMRFFSMAKSEANFKKMGQYLYTSLSTLFLLSVLFFAGIYLLKNQITGLLLGPQMLNSSSIEWTIVLIAGSTALNLLSSIFKSLIDSYQRLDISNLILIAQSILFAVFVFWALEHGFGILGVAYANFFASLVTLALNILGSGFVVRLRIPRKIFELCVFREIFAYSFNLQISSVSRMLLEPLNKVVINSLLGVQYVGYYDIAMKFSSKLHGLITSLLNPVFPYLNDLFFKNGVSAATSVMKRIFKSTLPIWLWIHLSAALMAIDFVPIWLKVNNPVDVVFAIAFLIFSNLIIVVVLPLYSLYLVSGKVRFIRNMQLVSLSINVLLTLVFSFFFGFIGFCMAILISQLFNGTLLFLKYSEKVTEPIAFVEIFSIKLVVIGVWTLLSYFVVSFIPVEGLTGFIYKAAVFLVLSAAGMFWVERRDLLEMKGLLFDKESGMKRAANN